MIKVDNNNNNLNVKDGLVKVDNLNDTLDSCVIVLENVGKLTLEPMDYLDILIDNEKRRYIISDINEAISTYQPLRYNYTIQVVSALILLERITLPDISIKRVYKEVEDENDLILIDGYYSRSVAYYINQYVNEYCPDFGVDARLLSIARTKLCPEMSFNQPNLRELLITLLSTLDLLLDMNYNENFKNYVISYVDANKKGNAIDTNYIDTDTTNYSINYYASNLDSQLKNAIANTPVSSIRYLTARTDDAILTTDNASIILDEPIYDILKVELNARIFDKYLLDDAENKTYIQWIDITDHIVEKSVYEGLKIGIANNYTDLLQINTLYFTRGGNKIEGLGKQQKFVGVFNAGTTLTNLLAIKFNDLGMTINPDFLDDINKVIAKNLLDILFRVTYLPQQEIRFKTEKVKKQKHESTLFNKQDSSFVNIELFGNNALDTINRIGNPERTITGVYNNYSQCPKLGDYIDDYILDTRTMSIYDNYVVFEGNLTKDFSNKYQYNALNSEKRYFQISEDVLTRHEVIPQYYIYDYNNYNDDSNKLLANEVLKYIPKVCKYAAIRADFYDDTNSDTILSELTTYKTGNSILMSLGFDNNIYAGNSKGNKDTGGYYQEPIKYTDEYGENIGVNIGLYNDLDNKIFTSTDEYITFSKQIAAHLPRLNGLDILGMNEFNFYSNKHKDQSEIQKWTIQHIFVSNNNDIIIGNEYFNIHPFYVGYGQLLNNMKVIRYSDEFKTNVELNVNKITELGTADDEDIINITDNYMTFKFDGNIGITYNNKLILGINNYVANKKVFLNISNKRNV